MHVQQIKQSTILLATHTHRYMLSGCPTHTVKEHRQRMRAIL